MVWKGIKPKDGEAGSKTVGDIKYHWCPHHKFWTTHKPDECTLAIHAPAEATKPTAKTPAKRTQRSLAFAKAAAAIAGNNGEDDDSVEA
jgi:hypothetical protein